MKITVANPSAVTLYAVILDATGTLAYRQDTHVFEAKVDANRTAYALALAASNLLPFYEFTFPTLAAGLYAVTIFRQVGGSPASTDRFFSGGSVDWTGTAEATVANAAGTRTLAVVTSVPTLPCTADEAQAWSFTLDRNRRAQTATLESVFAEDGTTAVATATNSDDGAIFTRGAYVDA